MWGCLGVGRLINDDDQQSRWLDWQNDHPHLPNQRFPLHLEQQNSQLRRFRNFGPARKNDILSPVIMIAGFDQYSFEFRSGERASFHEVTKRACELYLIF